MIRIELVPVALFVYNRPEHTKLVVEALKKNELANESDLFIFSDGPKVENDENVKRVREYIRTVDGFKSITIIEREKNFGCANSIISGVDEVINKFGKVIVLEDDIVATKHFLKYMNNALVFFKERGDVFSISGYNFPPKIMKIPSNYKHDIYFSYRLGAWGWGTWIDRWSKVDWEMKDYEKFKEDIKLQKRFNRGGKDMFNLLKLQMEGKIDAWDIRFDYAHFENDSYNIRPVKSLTKNIGLDGTGTHCGSSDVFYSELDDSFLPRIEEIGEDKKILKFFAKAAVKNQKYSFKRFLGKVWKRILRIVDK